MEPKLKYINGDVTSPIGDGKKLIIHCCNDIGVMGAGVALALANKWPVVKSLYKLWHKSDIFDKNDFCTIMYDESDTPIESDFNSSFHLGAVQFIQVEDNIVVGNMIGQHHIRPDSNGRPPIRYKAISKCLEKVNTWCKENNATVHAPRFGSALAGGEWDIIKDIIGEELISKGVYPITIYDWK